MALDSRQRNPFGQFAQAVSSSPDMMKKAYGAPSPSVPASALLALLKRKKGAPLPTLKPKAAFAARLEDLVEFEIIGVIQKVFAHAGSSLRLGVGIVLCCWL